MEFVLGSGGKKEPGYGAVWMRKIGASCVKKILNQLKGEYEAFGLGFCFHLLLYLPPAYYMI